MYTHLVGACFSLKGDIKTTLLGMGFSDKESQIYIYLGKRGPQKGATIAKQLKINKGQVYRTLKDLQKNGVVESTLEYPAKFVAVPLESVIDSFIKSKREEVDHIEQTKKDLVNDWNKIRQIEVDSSLEKFCVVEGEKKVFHKISQMIKEAKKELLTIVSVNALIKAENYGIFEDLSDHHIKNTIKFRFLTQLTKNDLKPIKMILKKIEPELDFIGKDPNRESSVCPRMIIKDRDEILLFISDKSDVSSRYKLNAVLCTNCQSIINSFYCVFQDLWNQAKNIQEKIDELESGKTPSIMELIKNPKNAKRKYYHSLGNAKKEILIVTSSKRFVELAKNIDVIRKLCDKGVSLKIMTPITNENLKATEKLLECAEIKHIPVGYKETTIIDRKGIFQFNSPCSLGVANPETLSFKNVIFSNDEDYINETRKHLFEIWKKTHFPSETIMSFNNPNGNPFLGHHSLEKKTDFMQNAQYKLSKIDEKTVLKKINEEKKFVHKQSFEWSNKIKYFGTRAFASFFPIPSLSLPKMVIGVVCHDRDSSFGIENWVVVNILQKTKTGYGMIPVAFVQDSPEHVSVRKRIFKSFPVADNISVFRKGELHIQMNGKTLFAGWTKKIPLGTKDLYLPPASLIFEGYGEIKPGMFMNEVPSGRKQEAYYNSFDAFVTFFHPESQYVGSGVEAFIEREHVFISTV